jgi:hypothetical protein
LRRGRTTNQWDFEEGARKRKAMEDNALTREDRGGVETCEDVVL